ncbi:MAG: tetratricopeptide repeat protein [Bacteroidia bacterium]|nr:tetratricopeptide repeat protein [Bacteroidia bacterium]MDW8157298.1 tetratricopeptide repeat protein [Bacteroidia bacterium]
MHSAQSSKNLNLSSKPISKTQIPPKKPAWWQNLYIGFILAFILSIAAYWTTLKNQYALDDYVSIVQNKFTQKGFAGIKDLLLHDSLRGYLGEGSEFEARYYRPLSFVTFAIEIGIWKDKALPKSHLINILLLAITGCLILVLLVRYLHPEQKEIGFLTMLFFILHPIHTEAVANLKGRDEVLTFLFMLLSLLLLLRYLEKKNYRWIVFSCISFFLAMLSKENGVNLIGIIPLMLLLYRRLTLGKVFQITSIYLSIAILFILLRYRIVGFTLANPSQDYIGNFYYAASLHEKLATIFWILGRYLKMLFFPHPLSWHYYYREIYYQTFANPKALISLLLHIGAGAWALYYTFLSIRKKVVFNPYLRARVFCILFYLISIFLISNLVVNIGGYVGERFLYQASFAVCLGVAVGVSAFMNAINKQRLIWKQIVMASVGGVVLLFFIQTSSRCKDWKDNHTLFLADRDKCPDSVMGTKAAALAYRELGEKASDPQERERYFQLSEKYINHTLKVAPFFIDAWVEKGLLAYARKNLDEEEYCYKQGEKINPRHGNVRNNLAKVYITRAQNAQNQNDLAKALMFARKAREYAPQDPAVYSNLGLYFALNQQLDSAIFNYKIAVQTAPHNADHWYGLGWAYYQAQNMTEAAKAWIQTLQINPNHSQKEGMMPTIQQYLKNKQKQ